MDNFVLQAVAGELAELLVGQRLGKAYQIGATDLALDFRLRDGRWLIVSTDPRRLALYLTRRQPREVSTEARGDTPFTSLIKKYLGGGRLVSLDKLGYDRVVKFSFAAGGEFGPAVERALVVLLTGRGANALVLEAGRVLASLRERGEGRERYEDPEPPAEKLDPFLCSPERLAEVIALSGGGVAAAAERHLLGFAPVYARELAARAESAEPPAALSALLADLAAGPAAPVVYSSAPLADLTAEPGRDDFSLTPAPIRLAHLGGQTATDFPSVNEAADAAFTLLDGRQDFLAERQRRVSHLSARLKKQRALAANLRREQAGFSGAADHQKFGELLLANLHQAVKTERGFRVTDYYDPEQPQIEIPAADRPTAQEAAEHYFRLARKARHGQAAIAERLPGVEREAARLEEQLARLSGATRRGQLAEIAGLARRPATPAGSPAPPPRRKQKAEAPTGVRRYRSSDGYEILVGRTDRDNDALTFRTAKSFDLWFHAADYPGSHVILRNPQRRPVPPRAVTEAAQLAAKFSQARADSRVAVNYCERKFVTKPKGFAPGQVRLSSFKTVLVEPREAGERIQGL